MIENYGKYDISNKLRQTVSIKEKINNNNNNNSSGSEPYLTKTQTSLVQNIQ